jgi:DNA sulfur modification protein DndB
MKIPAIRAKIGDWVYYISTFTFTQVNQYVKKIDNELHTSESLRDQIQRSISDNFKSIKDYILTQDERFFNSLVLAIYDGTPRWVEVELDYGGEEQFYNMGFLELDGTEKIFPVDGQHRVEGIKAALIENPDLAREDVPILFIGHQNNIEGMQRTRRLFTSLNRYAKPVKLNDIIALDEDDSVAIITRDLLEDYSLFSGKRINNAEQKAIPDADKISITSLITLYQCNMEILKNYLKETKGINATKTFLLTYQKYRRPTEELTEFKNYCFTFWESFSQNLTVIQTYLSTDLYPARQFRNNRDGGNLLFRPIGILPFVQAIYEIRNRTDLSINEILQTANSWNFQINTQPWLQVLWNDIEHTMMMGSAGIVKLIFLYFYDPAILSQNELKKLKEGYASKINYNVEVDPQLALLLIQLPR